MEQNGYKPAAAPGCSTPAKGCAIIAAIAIIGIVGMLLYISRMPYFQNVVACKQNLTDIHNALERYAHVRGDYPQALDDLRKEFLRDVSVLSCPREPNVEYEYRKPEKSSPPDFVVIQCLRHAVGKEGHTVVLTLLHSGEVRSEVQIIKKRHETPTSAPSSGN